MPTPRPIIVAIWGVNSGVFMNRATTEMRLTPMPMPRRAVTMGRPMATTEPKATSSTTTAASRPRPSDDGIFCKSNQGLAKATSPWPFNGAARALTSLTASLRSASSVFSSVKEAMATWPSGAICGGVSTEVTPFTWAACCRKVATPCGLAPISAKTKVPSSPARPGKSLFSRS